MSREIALRHVRTAIARVQHDEAQHVSEQDRLFDDLGLDSTSIIELLVAVEDESGIEVDPDELSAVIFGSVGSLTDYVESKLAESPLS
jgi:acyl carrier protein